MRIDQSPLIPRWLFGILSFLGHVLVPSVFGFLAYLSIWENSDLTWQLVVVAVLMLLPFILPLIATYVSSATDKGVKFRAFAAVKSASWIEKLASKFVLSVGVDGVQVQLAAPLEHQPAKNPLSAFSLTAKKVLRTLWRYQQEQPNEDQRWGFGIHPSASDYSDFDAGITELLTARLITKDPKGLVYLNNEGMEFCKKQGEEFGQDGDIWTSFGPAN